MYCCVYTLLFSNRGQHLWEPVPKNIGESCDPGSSQGDGMRMLALLEKQRVHRRTPEIDGEVIRAPAGRAQ